MRFWESHLAMFVATVAVAIAIVVWTSLAWWQRRSLGNEARENARAACTARLGEEACRDHLDRYHGDCARLTYRGGGRANPSPLRIDAEMYLECVVLGVDGWVAENGRRREERQRNKR